MADNGRRESTTAPQKTQPQAQPFDEWAFWVKDNVEAFVVAFIIALIVRCFCLEVFKIPTGSMTPTLLGDHSTSDGSVGGDRIMVSKFMYHLFDLRRYDVVVFKYPLDTSRNFIKRLVGLPGEQLLVHQGDLYYRPKGAQAFRIARKPLRVQESIWIPVFPGPSSKKTQGNWEPTAQEAASFGDDSLVLDGSKVPGGEVACAYSGSVSDWYPYSQSGGGTEVGDLKLAATVTWQGGAGEVQFRIRSTPDWIEAILPASGKGTLRWQADGEEPKTASFESKIGDGRPHDVALLNYDGLAHLRIDGEVAAELSYRETLNKSLRKGSSGLTLVVKNGKASFDRVSAYRDVYYLPAGVLYPEDSCVTIPDHCYFMMGDNSPNSSDSRLWVLMTFALRDGRKIEADAGHVKTEGDEWVVRDTFGVEYRIKRSDVEGTPAREPSPFVREEQIVGKGFYVWFPLNRMKLIR